jgi:hypothetical protein
MPFKTLLQLVANFNPNLLRDLFGDGSDAFLKRFLGPNFGPWLDMFHRLYAVAELLSQSSNGDLEVNDLSSCMMLLSTFSLMPPKWSVHSLALIVEQVDPNITRMIFEMIEQISANALLKRSIKYAKKYQYDHPPPPPGATQNFVSYAPYDSLSEMLKHWERLHAVSPIILSIPAFARRFSVCSFGVARADVRATLQIRQRMLCISGHYNFAVSQLFSNRGKPRISRQMEQILREYFGNEIFKKLLQ